MKNMKKIPEFKNETEEKKFWKESDSTEYINWGNAERIVLADLKPTLKTISVRMPEFVIEELKVLGNKRDIPYQSLLKMFVIEKLNENIGGRKS